MPEKGLYLLHLSIHGLIRGQNLELGRDSDTGGQTKYVVELARQLGKDPRAELVELATREVYGKSINEEYSKPSENLSENTRIIRIPCGPKRYLKKESLWPYLDQFTDNLLQYFRKQARIPDIIHAHYADAGYVGAQISHILGVPLIFTGHSLGREKKAKLLEKGLSEDKIEEKYNITRRIDAEERALNASSFVIASTEQERDDQYSSYEKFPVSKMKIIPPGIDIEKFEDINFDKDSPPKLIANVKKFLANTQKPCILAVARADERKNFSTLLEAYGTSKKLQELANLIVVAGNRDDINNLEPGAKRVINKILYLIDKYDLYTKVAYPKRNSSEEIPFLYHYAKLNNGVFINPALTEPFGLTLIEASACGLPIVATDDGGPRDIIKGCKNGYLCNATSTDDIQKKLIQILTDQRAWDEFSKNGKENSKKLYSWKAHVDKYLDIAKKAHEDQINITGQQRKRTTQIDKAIVSTLAESLLGDDIALKQFIETYNEHRQKVGLCIISKHGPGHVMGVCESIGLKIPDVMICYSGAEIYYGKDYVLDLGWKNHLKHNWKPEIVTKLITKEFRLKLKDKKHQRHFRICFDLTNKKFSSTTKLKQDLNRLFRNNDIKAVCRIFPGEQLDILPIRGSVGHAIRHLAFKWGIEPDRILVAGYNASDTIMLGGNFLGVINQSNAIYNNFQNNPRIYYAKRKNAWALIDAIKHFNFYDKIIIPDHK